MSGKIQNAVRMALRSSDGMTAADIAQKIDSNDDRVRRALVRMPDAYIDRWAVVRGKKRAYAAVWSVVVPPDHCPRPTGRRPR